MIFCKELFNYENKLFYIYRKVKNNSVKPQYVNDLKEIWGCSKVIRQINRQTNESFLLFLIEIEDALIID